jgi:hypothetical protein
MFLASLAINEHAARVSGTPTPADFNLGVDSKSLIRFTPKKKARRMVLLRAICSYRCAKSRRIEAPGSRAAPAMDHAATDAVATSEPVSVITSGHARHAISPDCRCHRHCGRMEHSGSTNGSLVDPACTGPACSRCSATMWSTIPHRFSVHWMHAARLQVLLKRNRFSGDRPCRATSTKA